MLAASFWAVWGWLPSGLFGSDKVRVDSKNNDDERFIWESAAGVSFDQSVFFEERCLTDLAKKLLEFIGFPTELHVELLKEKKVTDLSIEVDEEIEKEGFKKKMKKVKEVTHEREQLIKYNLLWGCRCRQWRFLRFSFSPESADIPVATETGTHSANCAVGVRDAAVFGGVYGEVAGIRGLAAILPRFSCSSIMSGVER